MPAEVFALVSWLLAAEPGSPGATSPPAEPSDPAEIRASSLVPPRPRASASPAPSDKAFVTPGAEVNASDLLQEIIDEFAADVARLGAKGVSPILVDRLRVSNNMAPGYADVFETRLVSALQRAAAVTIIKCVECTSTQGRVQDGDWVVSRGFTNHDELKRIAERYGARTVLSGTLSLSRSPNTLAFDAQMVRAEDASITFAESYRVDPNTAILHRSADRAQSREERLKDLEDRLNARPHLDNALTLGVLVVPSDMPDGAIWAAYFNFRFGELFGEDRQWRVGGILGAALNPTRLRALLPQGAVEGRVTPKNAYVATCHLGGAAGMLVVSLKGGNAPVVSAVGDCVFGHRVTAQASLNYIFPTELGGEGGYPTGGVSPEIGMAWSW